MSSHATPAASVEQRGLLQSESYDLDDLESVENHETKSNRTWGDFFLQRLWKTTPSWLRARNILLGIVLLIGLAFLGNIWYRKPSNPDPKGFPPVQAPHEKTEKWDKPKDFKIIGLIFFGRPSVVAILDCYLKKNLVSNGGFLDEVHWVVNTENEEDIHYLDELVKTSERYMKITIPLNGYNNIWEHAVEKEHMYMKIDDDIVWQIFPCSYSSLLSS